MHSRTACISYLLSHPYCPLGRALLGGPCRPAMLILLFCAVVLLLHMAGTADGTWRQQPAVQQTHRQLRIHLVHPALQVSIQLGRARHARPLDVSDAARRRGADTLIKGKHTLACISIDASRLLVERLISLPGITCEKSLSAAAATIVEAERKSSTLLALCTPLLSPDAYPALSYPQAGLPASAPASHPSLSPNHTAHTAGSSHQPSAQHTPPWAFAPPACMAVPQSPKHPRSAPQRFVRRVCLQLVFNQLGDQACTED